MKKTFLIVSILSIIFLAGCGIFNLNGWVWPDDLEFITCIEELNTPQKIGNYMMENFTYYHNDSWLPDPYTLWQTERGDCNDLATFGQFAAFYNDVKSYLIKIWYSDTFEKHVVAIYIEDEGLSFTDCWLYFDNDGFYYDSFREIVVWDSSNVVFYKWTKYKVYDYWNNLIEKGYNYVH